MSRNLRIPALVLLFFAFVLLFLVSISLPYLTALDFVRIHTSGAGSAIGAANGAIEELRVRFPNSFSC